MTIYIDAGYWSYWTGAHLPFALWLSEVDPSFIEQALFLVDSPYGQIRHEEYPPYKASRVERRSSDPRKAEIAANVKEFRRGLLVPSFGLRSHLIPGYEADDLVALLPPLGPGEYIIGIDKDYAQLPHGPIFKSIEGGNLDPWTRFMDKLPRYARPCLEHRRTNRWFAIYQALAGDKSDSIPRVLPSHSISQARAILDGVLGDGDLTVLAPGELMTFLANLRLVTLPHPSLLPGNPSGEELFEMLYWGSPLELLIGQQIPRLGWAQRAAEGPYLSR